MKRTYKQSTHETPRTTTKSPRRVVHQLPALFVIIRRISWIAFDLSPKDLYSHLLHVVHMKFRRM